MTRKVRNRERGLGELQGGRERDTDRERDGGGENARAREKERDCMKCDRMGER